MSELHINDIAVLKFLKQGVFQLLQNPFHIALTLHPPVGVQQKVTHGDILYPLGRAYRFDALRYRLRFSFFLLLFFYAFSLLFLDIGVRGDYFVQKADF